MSEEEQLAELINAINATLEGKDVSMCGNALAYVVAELTLNYSDDLIDAQDGVDAFMFDVEEIMYEIQGTETTH